MGGKNSAQLHNSERPMLPSVATRCVLHAKSFPRKGDLQLTSPPYDLGVRPIGPPYQNLEAILMMASQERNMEATRRRARERLAMSLRDRSKMLMISLLPRVMAIGNLVGRQLAESGSPMRKQSRMATMELMPSTKDRRLDLQGSPPSEFDFDPLRCLHHSGMTIMKPR